MENLKIGVVGTGAIGREHIRRLSEKVSGCRIAAVSDINETAAGEVAEKYGAEFYKDSNELIRSKDVDAIVITAGDPAHASLCIAGLHAGKFIFCEKPLATEVPECEKIVQEEQKCGKRLLQVGFMRRYDPGYVEMKRLIRNGSIGTPLMVHACHRNMTHAPSMNSDLSIRNSGIHEIDIMRWLLEEDYDSCDVIIPKHNSHADPDMQDPQIMRLRTKSGVEIDVEIAQNSGYGYDIQCEVVGELGTIKLPDPAKVDKKIKGVHFVDVNPDWESRFSEAYEIELAKWVDEVKTGKVTGPSAWDGYMACLAADTLSRSRVDGERKKIIIPEKPALYI